MQLNTVRLVLQSSTRFTELYRILPGSDQRALIHSGSIATRFDRVLSNCSASLVQFRPQMENRVLPRAVRELYPVATGRFSSVFFLWGGGLTFFVAIIHCISQFN